jgi:hypothetical protein
MRALDDQWSIGVHHSRHQDITERQVRQAGDSRGTRGGQASNHAGARPLRGVEILAAPAIAAVSHQIDSREAWTGIVPIGAGPRSGIWSLRRVSTLAGVSPRRFRRWSSRTALRSQPRPDGMVSDQETILPKDGSPVSHFAGLTGPCSCATVRAFACTTAPIVARSPGRVPCPPSLEPSSAFGAQSTAWRSRRRSQGGPRARD